MIDFAGVSDEELALLYVGGDNRAFDEILVRNQSKIFSYILFVVGDEDTANDLFQDTFVKVIMRLQEGRYTNSGRFSYWVTRIAHNVIMDWYRQTKNERIVEPTVDNDLTNLRVASVMDTNRESELVHQQVLCDVRRLMESLPATQREVVYMRFYQCMSFREISEITGVSINTSLGRMRYAILNMRRMAKDYNIALGME